MSGFGPHNTLWWVLQASYLVHLPCFCTRLLLVSFLDTLFCIGRGSKQQASAFAYATGWDFMTATPPVTSLHWKTHHFLLPVISCLFFIDTEILPLTPWLLMLFKRLWWDTVKRLGNLSRLYRLALSTICNLSHSCLYLLMLSIILDNEMKLMGSILISVFTFDT